MIRLETDREWIEAGDFIAADVIRWTEAVFDRKGRSKKAVKIGERRVTAEVLEHDGDWARLLVRACEITRDEQAGRTVEKFKPETSIKRASKTIRRGKAERLRWNDETKRDSVVRDKQKSRFVPKSE